MESIKSYFFAFEPNLPVNGGFTLFGTIHLSILAACAVCCLVYFRRFSRKERSVQETKARRLAVSMVALEALRLLFLALIRSLSVYELPLHLCGIAGFLCLLHAFTGKDWIGQTLYVLCLPGTMMALVFPDWTQYPAFGFISLQSFVFHSLIVLYCACQLKHGAIKPRLSHIWKPALFLCVTLPLIYLFNIAFGTNYFFINEPSKGSPLSWMAGYLGVPGYDLGYAAMAAVVVLAMYGASALFNRKKGWR